MRYLIISNSYEPFLTEWFDYENHYNKDIKMIVFDLIELKYTIDGITWKNIEIDNL